MKDTTLDPKRQLLIAALYGELDADGEARFQAAIEADPVLRGEWEELRETRALLETASATEPAITREFVFVRPPETKPSWRQRFFAFSPAWGFASVACGLVILLGAGLRLDRIENGFALRFGQAPAPVVPAPQEPTRTVQPTVDLPIPTDGKTRGTPISEPITQEDLNRYSIRMLDAMETLVDESQMEHNQRMARILGEFYKEMSDEQDRKYQILRQRLDGVGLGLMSEQTRMSNQISRLIDGPVNDTSKDSLAAPQQPEEDK